MVYIVWYENSRRIFYDLRDLVNFLQKVPINKVQVFYKDISGNIKSVDVRNFVSSFNNHPVDNQNLDDNTLTLNNISNVVHDKPDKKTNNFLVFLIRTILIVSGLLVLYLIIPFILKILFSK